MPLSFQVRTKPVSFLWGMVTGEFIASSSYLAEYEGMTLKNRITAAFPNLPEAYDQYIDRYADCVVYTQSLTFNWLPDVAPELREFEHVWQRILKGDDAVECFNHFGQLPTTVLYGYTDPADEIPAKKDEKKPPSNSTIGWNMARIDALSIWTPLETRPSGLLTEEERSDPN